MLALAFTFIVYVFLLGFMFWLCDYVAGAFVPPELQPKVHVFLVVVFALMLVAIVLNLLGAVSLPLPGIHPLR